MLSTAPIFIVGAGRSGTTLVYEMLRGHPSLAWISNVSERFPGRASAAAVNRLAPLGPSPNRPLALRPTEGYRVFDWASPRFTGSDSPPLRAENLTTDERHRLQTAVRTHIRGMGRERFVNKNTRNTRRIPYLCAAFPDAKVIHVVRHPAAVVASLLRVDFWRNMALWTDSDPSHRFYFDPEAREAALAARLWREEVTIARGQSETLDAYFEIRYEQVIQNPRSVIASLLSFSELQTSTRFDRHLDAFDVRNEDREIQRILTPTQMSAVSSVASPVANELGYNF